MADFKARCRFYFFSHLYARARRALADGRTMVAGAGDGAVAGRAASYGVIANRSPNSAALTLPFLFLLSPIRAREAGAAALWLMAERWSPEPAMVRSPGAPRATGSSPTDRQIPPH